jgi:raffinose/stachyose/melibiose transport system substrate-binding protein
MKTLKHLIYVILITVLLVSCAPATKAPEETAPPEVTAPTVETPKEFTVVVIGKSVHPYWSNVEKGVIAAAEDLGLRADQAIFFVPQQEDVAAQMETMETYIAQGVTGIAIAPSDPNALEPVMKKAADAGIIVTTLDTPPVEGSVSKVYIGTDNYSAGKTAGEAMAQLLPEGGTVGIGRGSDTALNALQRTDGFLEAIKGTGIKTLEPVNDQEDAARALELANSVLSANPDLAGAFGVYAYNGPAWATAIKEAGRVGLTRLVSFDATTDIINGIKEGVIDATVAQREFDMGYKSVNLIYLMATKGAEAAMSEMGVVDGIIDTGVDVITPATLKDYEAGLDAKGIPHEWDTKDWEPPSEAAPVTIEWWHITTVDPGKALWQTMADEYMAAHPNVKINITILENEAFKTKLTTVMQGGTPPDIFQSWGGGVMNDQINAGLLLDITSYLDADGGAWRNSFAPGALAVYALDGKNYGVPWDMGMVGWWYNKDLFAQANITQVPTTWTELLDDVKTLKAAGITPISLAGKDTWTGMHIWSYLATRLCGQDGFLAAANRTGSFTDPCFVEAGTKLQELIALEPFQPGFLGAIHDEMQGYFGNGKAAMELSGQWAPSVESAQAADGVGVANLGFFSFPAVEGGAGALTDAMGGGNGFAIGKNAAPEAVDFVKYLTAPEQQKRVAAIGAGIPVVKGGEAGLTDPNMILVQKGFAAADYFQLYYDQYMPSAMGSIINDATAGLYAGTMTPEQVAQAIEDGAKQVFGK